MANDFVSDEDKALFRQLRSTVKPLHKSKKISLKPAPVITHIRQKQKTVNIDPVINTPAFYLSNTYLASVAAEDILTFGQQNMPSKRFRELKGGQIPWQGRLDLHGLNPDKARDVLSHFIEMQLHTENRCFLIIHGKGGLHGEAPILKNRVNDWLRQIPQILAFHSALAKDGGTGAVYVLLKRQRQLK